MKQTSTSIHVLNGKPYNEQCTFFFSFSIVFFFFFFFVDTLINNEWTPMKIHTQMIKSSPHTDVTQILTNKTTSQTEISKPLPMGWTGGKNVTILYVMTCEKPLLKVKQGQCWASNDEGKDKERISQVVICDAKKSDEMMSKRKISQWRVRNEAWICMSGLELMMYPIKACKHYRVPNPVQ